MANAAITVDLNAKIAQFETEMKKATGSLDRFEKKGSAMAAGLKSAFVGMAATLSVGMFVGFIKSNIDAQDAISKLSQKTGIAVESLAGLQHAADLSDVGVEQLAKGIRTFGVVVAESERGMKSYQDKLTMLGLDYKKLKDLKPEEQFYALADAVSKLSKEDRAVAVAGALGDKMSALVPLLSGGSDALRQMVEEGKKYNPVTAESARLAEEFNDNLTRLKASAGAVGVAIATDLLPPLNKFLERLMLVKAMNDAGGVFNLLVNTAGTDDLNAALQRINKSIDDTQRAIDSGADNTFKEKLANLKAMRDVLINTRVSDIMAPPTTDTMRRIKEERAAAVAAASAGTTTPTKSGSKSDPQGAFVAKLRQEAETLGLSGEALQRYEAIKLKLTGTNKQLADSYISQIAEFKRLAGDQEFATMVMQDGQETINLANQNMRDWEETVKSAGQELTDMISPVNVLIRKLTELDKFDGFMDPEVLAAARLEINAQIDALGEVETKLSETDDTAKQLGLTFASAFEDAIVEGKKFKDVLKGLAQDILRIATRKAITEPLAGAVSGLFSGMFKASANGNVISSPALSAYSGSVVSSPTVFPFANGIGLMGEAGAEAILPLKRGSNGKLGVSMDGGGGVTVQNYYTIDARGADAGAEQRIRRAMAETEDRAVSRSVTQVQSMNQRGQLRLA